LKKKIVKAFSWDFAGSILGFGSTFLTSVILSRILTPEEFGIIAIAMAFILIFNVVSEFGLKQALIQSIENSELDYSSVFYINLGVGTILGVGVFLLAPLIAAEFNEAPLSAALQMLSGTIILNSLTTVQIAILSKRLDFKALSIRMIIAKVLAAVIGIILAYSGWGLFSLIWQEIIFAVLNAVLLWYVSDWRPSLRFSWDPIRRLYQFGLFIFLNRAIDEVILRLDELIIGKVFSTATLGYYDRSNIISQNINGLTSKSVYNVFFPVLSELQSKPVDFERMYVTILTAISIVSFGITGLAFLGSEPIIIGLFGDQWFPSIPIFQILMFKLFTYPASRFLNVGLLAKGYAKQHFLFGLIKKSLRISTYIIAFMYGFEPFLYASVVVSFINVIFSNVVNNKYLGINLFLQVRPLLVSSLICAVSITIVYIIDINKSNTYINFLINGGIFALAYTGISVYVNRTWIRLLIMEFKTS